MFRGFDDLMGMLGGEMEMWDGDRSVSVVPFSDPEVKAAERELRELAEHFEKHAQAAETAVGAAVRLALSRLLTGARERTHVFTGALASSHRAKIEEEDAGRAAGLVFVSPVRNPFHGMYTTQYAKIEADRGGEHDFYAEAVAWAELQGLRGQIEELVGRGVILESDLFTEPLPGVDEDFDIPF